MKRSERVEILRKVVSRIEEGRDKLKEAKYFLLAISGRESSSAAELENAIQSLDDITITWVKNWLKNEEDDLREKGDGDEF